MKAIILMICLFLLTGCSSWCHSWKGQAEFDRDKYMCTAGMGGDPDAQMLSIFNMGDCLHYKYGWYKCKGK